MTIPEPPAAAEAEDILLIEDDPDFSVLSATLMEVAGHRCRHAGSGREAIEWLGTHAPRLVITDYELPDMTAAELAARVQLPPFIVTTGAGSEQVAVEMMKLGARDYLTKGTGFIESLPRAVARVLRELEVEARLEQAEQALREAENRWLAALEGSGLGVWDWDAVKDRVFFSHQWKAMLGYADDEITDALAEWDNRVHPEDRAGVYQILEAHLRGETPSYESEHRMRCKDGSYKWILDRGTVMARDPGGKPLRVAGTHQDITDRKRAEEQELRHLKMESLGLMAGGIAHDFNNMFQTLLSNLELIGPRLAGDTRGRSALDRCHSILGKASELSRRMLDYSGGALRADLSIDLGDLVRQESAGLAHHLHAQAPGLELVCHLQEGLPRVSGDPSLLGQVLKSLVHNAAEAMTAMPGRIEVTLSQWDPAADSLEETGWEGEAREAPGLCLAVRDFGCGIPRDLQHRIFDPFFTTKAPGRGLGLSATLGIVRSHGGSIHVTSTPDAGSTFRVLLPPAAAEAETAAPPVTAQPLGRMILLVDDEDDLRASLAEILTDILEFQVIEARDGVEAVERFKAHAADVALVIMDVTMPRMTGIQAWEEIRRAHPAARGILCSGYSEETGTQLASGHGFLGFLKKPFNLKTLRETIRTALPEVQV